MALCRFKIQTRKGVGIVLSSGIAFYCATYIFCVSLSDGLCLAGTDLPVSLM